jgi:hypothetical protein
VISNSQSVIARQAKVKRVNVCQLRGDKGEDTTRAPAMKTRTISDLKSFSGWGRRALWTVHLCLLPGLIVFFLCPCGSIYKPDAPHGVREASWVVDAVGSVVVTPVVLAALPVVAAVESVSYKGSSSSKDDPSKVDEKKKTEKDKEPEKPKKTKSERTIPRK